MSGWAIRGTVDGGDTWTPRSSPTTLSLNAVTSISTSTVIAVGAGGTILKKLDGGFTWTSRPRVLGANRSLYDVFFVDANNGWAVGQSGTIRKTSDGGDTWTVGASSGASITILLHSLR